jgi:2-octaprenyl-6-methoxyphenol hydroxylase
MPTDLTLDVAVIGAGPVGATLALRLAEAGIATAVIDRAALPPMEHPAFDGRAYAIAAGSRRLLEEAGLWHRLPDPPGPITAIRVSDGKVGRPASPLFLHFDIAEIGHEPGDGAAFGWMVEARSLRRALNATLAEGRVQLYAPAEATIRRDEHGAAITLADGTRIGCRLVIAAEGRESPLRRQARIPVTRFPYRQSGIVAAIAHEFPHHNTALEHFLPAGPFAQLPMAANEAAEHVSAVVWTERPAMAAHLMTLDDAAFGAEIARRLGDHLGAIRPIGRRWLYPLSALYAHRYVDQRLVLVGDAAHGIHPIAGQGLNLGFQDAITLADLLIGAARQGDDLGAPALLMRYQRARRGPNLLMLAATDALDRLFSNDIPPLRLARDLGIAMVHRLPPLKRFFMRQAMGVTSTLG